MTDALPKVAEEQGPVFERAGEEFKIPEKSLRLLSSAGRESQCFEDFATVAIEDPVTTDEFMGNARRQQWQKKMMEEMRSIEGSGTWKKIDLPSEKYCYIM